MATRSSGEPSPAVPDVPAWEALASQRAVVYLIPGTVSDGAAHAIADRLDTLIAAVERDGHMKLPGRLVYPIYPDAERFRKDWWQFAVLRDGVVHGWGTAVEDGRAEVSTYQVARLIARLGVGPAVPLLGWGIGDLLGDRQIATDSHAHARLFLDRTGLPAVESIVHQMDFGQALPGAYAQSVSFLGFLVEEHGMPAVVEFARTGGRRWYDFGSLFERTFGMSVAEADRRWRRRLERVPAPALSEREFDAYQRATRFVYGYTLARDPGGLILRPGGATAYLYGLRATDALRRFDVAAATAAMQRGSQGLEAAQRSVNWTRLALRVALWGFAVVPITLAILVLAWPSLRSAWRDRRRRRRRVVVSRRA